MEWCFPGLGLRQLAAGEEGANHLQAGIGLVEQQLMAALGNADDAGTREKPGLAGLEGFAGQVVALACQQQHRVLVTAQALGEIELDLAAAVMGRAGQGAPGPEAGAAGVVGGPGGDFAAAIIGRVMAQAGKDEVLAGIGVAGSLSALRLRIALRDPKDMVFIFAGMAVGVACGLGAFTIAIAGSLVFCVAVASPLAKCSSTARRVGSPRAAKRTQDRLSGVSASPAGSAPSTVPSRDSRRQPRIPGTVERTRCASVE